MDLDQVLKRGSSDAQYRFTTDKVAANSQGIFWFQSFRIFKSGLLKIKVTVTAKNNQGCTIAPLIHDCVCIEAVSEKMPRKRTRSDNKDKVSILEADDADTKQEIVTRQRDSLDSLYYIGTGTGGVNGRKKTRGSTEFVEASLTKKAKADNAKSAAAAASIEESESNAVVEALSLPAKRSMEFTRNAKQKAAPNTKKSKTAMASTDDSERKTAAIDPVSSTDDDESNAVTVAAAYPVSSKASKKVAQKSVAKAAVVSTDDGESKTAVVDPVSSKISKEVEQKSADDSESKAAAVNSMSSKASKEVAQKSTAETAASAGDSQSKAAIGSSTAKSVSTAAPEIPVTKIKKKLMVQEYLEEEDPVEGSQPPLDAIAVTQEKLVNVVSQEKPKPKKELEEGEIDAEEEAASQQQEAVCFALFATESVRSSMQRSHSIDNMSSQNAESTAVKSVSKSKKAAKPYTLPRANYYRQCKKLLDCTLENLKLDKIPDQVNVQDYNAIAHWLFLHESKHMERETTISNIRDADDGDDDAYNPLVHTLGCLFLAGKAENVFFKADFLLKAAFGDIKVWKEIFADVPDAANTTPPPVTAADIYKYEFVVLCNIRFNFNNISKPVKLIREWSGPLGGRESALYSKLMEYFENNKHYLMDKKLLEHGETEIALARIIVLTHSLTHSFTHSLTHSR